MSGAPAYMLVTMKISDPERYKDYVAQGPVSVKAFGGEYLVRGGRKETLEGGWEPNRVVVLKFPSYERAKAWYDSQEYGEARKLREGATEYFNMLLIEGVEAPV